MQFRVLGAIEVWNATGPVRIAGTTQSKALAVLLTEVNHTVPLHRLVEALWDERPPATARRQVQNAIAALRRVLAAHGADPVERLGDGYRLTTGELDWLEFQHEVARAQTCKNSGRLRDAERLLSRALGLWQGPALAAMSGTLIEAVAHRMDQARWSATEDLIDVELALGLYASTIDRARALVMRHPSRQRTTGQLMLALHFAGRNEEALQVYADLRARLADDLGLTPDSPLQLLHGQILRGEAPIPTAKSDRPASRSETPAPTPRSAESGRRSRGRSSELDAPPRQLPSSTIDFTGRIAQLDRLDELLDSEGTGAVRVAVIMGTAGVGKTALALHWAHHIADRFPDGQLHANLRGYDPVGGPMSPGESVRAFLAALGVPPERMPPDLDSQAALYRSLLSGKRTLVVLDNVRDADQVRSLLPGTGGSLVIITSRNRLSSLIAHGASPITLALFTADEAELFLTRRLGRERTAAEPAAVGRIIEACAGLPLALAVVAARAAIQPEFPLDALAAALRDAGARLDALADPDPVADLRAVCSWSYQALTDETARLFRMLSVHPGPEFTAAAAASLAGIGLGRADRMLSELADAHLLEERTPGRYAFHDLLRAYASELAAAHDAPDDRNAAAQRLLDHYVHTAYAANRLIGPHRDPIELSPAHPDAAFERPVDGDDAEAWFHAERATLAAAVRYAAGHGFDTHCWQLNWSFADFLFRQGCWHEMVEASRTALAAARRLGDAAAQARGCRLIARGSAAVRASLPVHNHIPAPRGRVRADA